jgi:glycosyltransferase involved in cell wall biosynthesis
MANNDLSQKIPLVSVVMAVKNGSDYIRQSLNSVIHQTFSDFEIIVINDGSEDDTLAIVESLKDARIRIYSQKNRGVARAANRGLALARGKYIARIDHDDLWFPERLAKQIAYLESHPEIALVGSAAVIWSGNSPTDRGLDHPTTSAEIQWELLFNNPFVHSSILFRKEVIKNVGLYSPCADVTPLDDYQFISRVAWRYQVANLSDRLVVYREMPQSLTSSFRGQNLNLFNSLGRKLAKISAENLANLNGIICNDSCHAFGMVIHRIPFKSSKFMWSRVQCLLSKALNRLNHSYDQNGTIDHKAVNIKLHDLEVKWFSKNGPASFTDRTLYLKKNVPLNLKQVHKVKHEWAEKVYWDLRELIYFRFGGRVLFNLLRKFQKYFRR